MKRTNKREHGMTLHKVIVVCLLHTCDDRETVTPRLLSSTCLLSLVTHLLRKLSWPVLSHSPNVWLYGLRKTTEPSLRIGGFKASMEQM